MFDFKDARLSLAAINNVGSSVGKPEAIPHIRRQSREPGFRRSICLSNQMKAILFISNLGCWVSCLAASPEPGLLFYLSGDHEFTADYAAGGDPQPISFAA
jgi:hypothetical protein